MKFIHSLITRFFYILLIGIILGIIITFTGRKANHLTSTDFFCESCHIHPQATASWKLSTHYNNKSGVIVHCIECHLPPEGLGYLREKARLGARDIYGKLFKDVSEINWDEKSKLENAVSFTYKESCLRCHQNLFPLSLSKEGDQAHFYYSQKTDKLRCLNCHLYVGHFTEKALHAANIKFGKTREKKEIYTTPARIGRFENFTEYIPGSDVKFEMIAITGGTFSMGSPESEPYRENREGPQRKVKINRFFMGKTEVTWDEYLAFYYKTASEGKTSDQSGKNSEAADPDAITGATPPWGAPDQGWGMESRPAITMTFHAAETYCRWLSIVTGKKYRLPTEAEWEYAYRAGTTGPYFFKGDPKNFSRKKFWRRIFKFDTTTINRYVNFSENSQGKTIEPSKKKPNPFGLINMLGNVSEFCHDWYAPDIYSQYVDSLIIDPAGPNQGNEHVVRGGSYKSRAKNIRSTARDHTRTESWLMTDPQMPKSIWWYSDCNHVGFRVVCEYEENKD